MMFNSKNYTINQMHIEETRRKAEQRRMISNTQRTPLKGLVSMVQKMMPERGEDIEAVEPEAETKLKSQPQYA